MSVTLLKFLESKKLCGDGFYTHQSMYPAAKYNIQRKDIEEFWQVYCDTINEQKECPIGLQERSFYDERDKETGFLPVIVDIDIKLPFDPHKHDLTKRLYKEYQLKECVMIYQRHLKNLIKDYKPEYGMCIVLEKSLPRREEDYIKQGFHLHFINFVMSRSDQRVHLFQAVKDEMEKKEVFHELGVKHSGDLLDDCITKPWLMYGSKKSENQKSYEITKIFNDGCEEILLYEALERYRLFNIDEEEIKMDKYNLEYYLPRILSIHPKRITEVSIKKDATIVSKSKFKKAKNIKEGSNEAIPITELLDDTRELVNMLSRKRADEYNDWIRVGWAIFNVGQGSREAFEIWNDFSKKTTKPNGYNETTCLYYWQNMKPNEGGLTIRTLRYWASQDKPKEFKKWNSSKNLKYAEESLNGGHYDIAKILYNMYSDEYVCACVEKGVWYRYTNHHWRQSRKGINLMKRIPEEVVTIFKEKKREIGQSIGEDDDDSEAQKKLKLVNKIISNLKNMSFIKNILSACELLFYDEYFYQKLDSDPHYVHFNNGVLDLRDNIFRSGRPTDYISLTTGYDFINEYDWEHPEVVEVLDHLSKVFPDPLLKQYFIEYCANLLKGGNNIKTFLCMSGEGDNGKSINMDLLQQALGKYMKILPTSLITQKNRTQSSAATPELAGIQGVKFAILQEPNNKDVINIGILKELSGNDIIYVRGLFKEAQEVRPQFKLSLICNRLPRLPCDDPATWNRIRVLPHEACFPKDTSTVPDTLEEQMKVKRFPRDPFFAEKIPRMKTAFMWVLWMTWKKICKEGRMKEPEKVQEATKMYRRDNDIFLQFIEEKIVYDPDNVRAIISITEFYNNFKSWFDESYPNMKGQIPSKEDTREEMVKKWGELNKAYKWKGYRLRTLEDDENEGKVVVIRDEDLLVEEEEEKSSEEKYSEDEDNTSLENENKENNDSITISNTTSSDKSNKEKNIEAELYIEEEEDLSSEDEEEEEKKYVKVSSKKPVKKTKTKIVIEDESEDESEEESEEEEDDD